MKLASSSVVLVAFLIAGCPGGPMTSADTGGTLDAPVMDGWGWTEDGGGTEVDGGATVDGGTATVDGGTTTGDGGTSDIDSGVVVIGDGGVITLDGGPGCASNSDCGRSQYCATEAGMCDTNGACLARPIACTDVFDPVCGCDGIDYSNECDAAAVGVNVASRGTCITATCDLRPRASCCFGDGSCGRGQRCVNETCAAGGEGTCVARPLRGQCWEDADCGLGGSCIDAVICACGERCFAPDAPGTCAFPG